MRFLSLIFFLIPNLLFSQKLLDVKKEPICFENPFMNVNHEIEIKRLKVYFSDLNLSQDNEEQQGKVRMFYTLKNNNTYEVPYLFLSYHQETQTYSGGVECDGGWMEYDVQHNVMYMEDIRGIDERDTKIKLPDNFRDDTQIETFNNPETGWLNTVAPKEYLFDKSEKVWVYGEKCKDVDEPKHKTIYYTTTEYLKKFPNETQRNINFNYFKSPLIKRTNSDISVVKLKKPYQSIAMMMENEGLEADWFPAEMIELFVHDNQRAFIYFSTNFPSSGSGGFCHGYKLVELEGDNLRVMSFDQECGTVVTPILYQKSQNFKWTK